MEYINYRVSVFTVAAMQDEINKLLTEIAKLLKSAVNINTDKCIDRYDINNIVEELEEYYIANDNVQYLKQEYIQDFKNLSKKMDTKNIAVIKKLEEKLNEVEGQIFEIKSSKYVYMIKNLLLFTLPHKGIYEQKMYEKKMLEAKAVMLQKEIYNLKSKKVVVDFAEIEKFYKNLKSKSVDFAERTENLIERTTKAVQEQEAKFYMSVLKEYKDDKNIEAHEELL